MNRIDMRDGARLSVPCSVSPLSVLVFLLVALSTPGCAVQITPAPTRIPPTFTPARDLSPPEQVTDLAASYSTTSTITLRWHAPRDNWGRPARYNLRYSLEPITDQNWRSAQRVISETIPSAAGVIDTMSVSGLEENTTYYFALRTIDYAGNSSALSNVASDTTLPTLEFELGEPDASLFGGTFQGFGAEWDPFYWTPFNLARGANQEGWQIATERIQALQIPFVRMMMDLYWVQKSPDLDQWTWDDPQFQILLRYLDFAQANDIDVMLTDWGWVVNPSLRGSAFYKPGDPRYAQGIARYVQELIDQRGYTCIKYLVAVNEPDTKIPNLFSLQEYVTLYRNLDRALRENGMRDKIKLVGPDVSYNDKVFVALVKELKDVIDVYDFHSYAAEAETSNRGVEEIEETTWYKLNWRRAQVLELDPDANTKPMLVTEFGPGFAPADAFEYAMHMADFGTTVLNTPTNGASAWIMQDVYYFENPRIFGSGMWHFADKGWALKPWAHAYALLIRFAPRGSIQAPVNSSPPKLPEPNPYRAGAVRRGDGGWSIFLVNRDKSAVRANVRLPKPPQGTFRRYQFSRNTSENFASELLLPPAETLPAKQDLRVTLPPESLIVLAESTPAP